MTLQVEWECRNIVRDDEGAAQEVCFQVNATDPDSLNHRQEPHKGIFGGIHKLSFKPKGLTEAEAVDLVQQELPQRELQNIEYRAKVRRDRLEAAAARKS